MTADANREGFRVRRSEPVLFAMELLWRWSFGFGLLALLFFAYAHLRQAILLSDADEAALSAQDPRPLQPRPDLISGALPLLLKTFAQLFGVAAVLWIAAAALGGNHHPDHRAPLCRRLLAPPLLPMRRAGIRSRLSCSPAS